MSFRISLALLVGLTFFATLLTSAQPRKPRSSAASRTVKLKCSPQKLFKGDTLTLDMATPHGGDLAVRAPDGTDFLVVYKLNDGGPDTRSLMEADDFIKLGQLKLMTDQVKARPWVYGRDKNELIFTRTGWYQVRLSENLLSDDGTPLYTCRVYYTNKPRLSQ